MCLYVSLICVRVCVCVCVCVCATYASLMELAPLLQEILSAVSKDESKVKLISRKETMEKLARLPLKHTFMPWLEYYRAHQLDDQMRGDHHLDVYNVPDKYKSRAELSMDQVLENIFHIYEEKVKSDTTQDELGQHRIPMPEYIRDFMITKHGLFSHAHTLSNYESDALEPYIPPSAYSPYSPCNRLIDGRMDR